MSASKTSAITTVSWGAGNTIAGTPFRQVVTSDQTSDRLVVLAVDMPVSEQVPAHVHDDQDQITVVISGLVGATLGNREVLLTEGSVLFMPRAVAHSQWNAGNEVARLLEIYTPSGIEKVFERVGATGASNPTDHAGQPS